MRNDRRYGARCVMVGCVRLVVARMIVSLHYVKVSGAQCFVMVTGDRHREQVIGDPILVMVMHGLYFEMVSGAHYFETVIDRSIRGY